MSKESVTRPNNRPPLHKRQYIVDPPFQYRLIGTLLAIWLANSVFFSFVLYFLYDAHLNTFYEVVPRVGMYPLMSLPSLLVTAVAFVCVFGLIVLSVVALYMSNQIAGPLYRMKKSIARVGRGEFGFELRFRQGDFLNDLPVVFNGMIERLRERDREELGELKAIESSLGDPAEAKRRIVKLRERKEGQLEVSAEGTDSSAAEPEPVSVAVH